jgi:hypothetical protein
MIDPFQFKINSKVILDSLDNFKIVDINFDIDYPALPIQGDYEIKLHFLIRP